LQEYSEDQRQEIGKQAGAFANELRSEESGMFVDRRIPDALEHLSLSDVAAVANQIVEDGANLLAADILQSISNIINPIATMAISYRDAFVKAAGEQASEQGKADGKKAIKWARNIIVVGSPIVYFLNTYPGVFGWLRPVIDFLARTMPS
jgi:hypothetical protein